MTNEQDIDTEKLNNPYKIKVESLDEDIEHDLANHQSLKTSTVFKEDLNDLYENHVIKEEVVIGPEVFQHAADIYTTENIFQQNNAKANKNRKRKKRKILSKSQDTSNNLTQPCDFECTRCAKKFRLMESLKKHMEAHDNPYAIQKEHNCKICGKVFKVKTSLNRHIKTHTDSTALFKCNICSKTYKTNQTLNYHHISNHSGDLNAKKQITCRYCSKVFSGRPNCIRHEKYQCPNNLNRANNIALRTTSICDYCQKSFSSRRVLIDHIMIHMGQGRKRPTVECDLCSKKFVGKYNLRIHIASKHQYIKYFFCKKCKKGFIRRWDLTNHEKKCQGQVKLRNKNLIECDLCSKKYKNKTGLINHIETQHLNIKRFSCEGCKCRFTTKWYLKQHKEKCLRQE